MKYSTTILIIVIAIMSYLYWSKPVDTSKYQSKIDSLNTLIKKDKLVIGNLIKDAEKTEVKEFEYVKEADSLAKIISTLHLEENCPKIVEVQGKEIKALRNGLEKCNEAKTIYVKTLGICQNVIVKYEIKEVTAKELNNALTKNYKKEKRKAFLFGVGVSGVAVLLLLLL